MWGGGLLLRCRKEQPEDVLGKCRRLCTNGVRCCVLPARQRLCALRVVMLNCLASAGASESLICVDSFVIGALDDEEAGGGARQDAHAQ